MEANKGGNQPSGQQRVNDNSADQANSMQKCSQVRTFVQIQQKTIFLVARLKSFESQNWKMAI